MCGRPQSGLRAVRFHFDGGAGTPNWITLIWACLFFCYCCCCCCHSAATTSTMTDWTESAHRDSSRTSPPNVHSHDPTRPTPSSVPATTIRFQVGGKRPPRPVGSSTPPTKTDERRQRQKSQPPGLCFYEPVVARLTCSGADRVTNELHSTFASSRATSGPTPPPSPTLSSKPTTVTYFGGIDPTLNGTLTGYRQLQLEFTRLTFDQSARIDSVRIEHFAFDSPLNLSALLTYVTNSSAVGRSIFPQLRQLIFYRNSFVSDDAGPTSIDEATTTTTTTTAAAGTNSKVESWSPFVELDQLRDFQLIGNNVTSLNASFTLRMMPQLRSLTINDNRLISLEQDSFIANRFLVNISMAGNNWSCQKMEWFLVWARLRPQLAFVDKESTVCEHNDGKATGRTTFGNLLDLCPANCSCHLVRALVEVDCRRGGFHTFPPVVPVNTSILHMENNSIASLESIVDGKNYAKLRFFYVDNNAIESLNFLERTDFYNGLVALHISGNRLSRVPVYAISRLTDLKLGRNPWRCECDAVSPFYDFLMSRAKDIRDVDDIRCAVDDSVIHRAASKHQFCYGGENAMHPLDVLNACLVLLILLVIVNVMYDYTTFQLTGRLPRGPCCYNLLRSACPKTYKPLSTATV